MIDTEIYLPILYLLLTWVPCDFRCPQEPSTKKSDEVCMDSTATDSNEKAGFHCTPQ